MTVTSNFNRMITICGRKTIIDYGQNVKMLGTAVIIVYNLNHCIKTNNYVNNKKTWNIDILYIKHKMHRYPNKQKQTNNL